MCVTKLYKKGGCVRSITFRVVASITKASKRKMQYTTVICLAMASLCYGHFGGQLSHQVPPQVYCGRVLARSLAILCYDRSSNAKRSEFGSMYNSILAPYYKDHEGNENNLAWWIPPNKAKSIGLSSRNKRLVVSECCEKPCKISELMSYC